MEAARKSSLGLAAQLDAAEGALAEAQAAAAAALEDVRVAREQVAAALQEVADAHKEPMAVREEAVAALEDTGKRAPAEKELAAMSGEAKDAWAEAQWAETQAAASAVGPLRLSPTGRLRLRRRLRFAVRRSGLTPQRELPRGAAARP